MERSKKHFRQSLLLLYNQKKNIAEAQRILAETYGESAPSISTCEFWYRRFKTANGNDSDAIASTQLATNGQTMATAPSTATSTAQAAKKVNKTSEMLETMSSANVNKNLDQVLKTVRQLDNTCDFARCRTKTSLIGQDCSLCEQRFCMKHQLPEVHGCGGAVKKCERTEFLKQKPRPTLPISAALRRNENKDAHARLEQKLKEMSLARQKAKK